MRAQLVLLAAGVLGGLGVGWLSMPEPQSEAAVTQEPAQLVHAGVEAEAAHARLDALGFAPEPVSTAPPPPDIAVLFRRDLTAIEDLPSGRLAWIVDFAQPHQRRALRIGDVYQDGWRVLRINAQYIELRRRHEVRRIDAFALPVIDP